MASDPKPKSAKDNALPSDSSQGKARLPFEPSSARKKAASKSQAVPPAKSSAAKSTPPKAQSSGDSSPVTTVKASVATAKASRRQSPEPSIKQVTPIARATVPEAVSQRMARRMAMFCGIPTTLGVLTFVVAYVIVTQGWFKLPNVAVLLVSMAWFGLGVLGLSYGVLSASWDENRVGTRLGWAEFVTNFSRMRASWREAKERL